MFITSDHGRSAWVSRPIAKLAFQALVTAIAAFFIPLAAPVVLFGYLPSGQISTANTQFISLGMALAALLIFRRVTAFPGARGLGFIVPAFSTTFGLGAALLLLLRIPYSGPMLLTGYVASVAVSFLFGLLESRVPVGRFYYVPEGNTGIVSDTPDIDWVQMTEAVLPASVDARIVADLRHTHSAEWERMLAEAAIAGIPVYHTKQLRESLTGRVQIEHLSENSFGSLIPALAYRGVKRTIDIVSSLVLLPILAPFLLAVAVLVRISSPGPIIFRQRRMGYRGQAFSMLKFRTMTDRSSEPLGSASRAEAITQDDDARITPIGRFLRKSRIDELPQIINILRGEMSWIGPRPEAVPLSEWYESEIPFYRYRHIVRPGITGWAQVNQGHVAQLDDVNVKLHYDFYYIKFFSFWLDVLISLRTIRIMLTGFGAK